MAQPTFQAPPQPPAPPKSRMGLYVAVAVVVIVVVILGALAAGGVFSPKSSSGSNGSSSSSNVDITAINWDLTGSSCSGNQAQTTTGGPTVAAGSDIYPTFTLVNTAIFGSCTFQDPSVTQGFTITSSNAPVTVNAGGTQTLQMTVVTPSSSWTGVLTVTLSVTTAL